MDTAMRPQSGHSHTRSRNGINRSSGRQHPMPGILLAMLQNAGISGVVCKDLKKALPNATKLPKPRVLACLTYDTVYHTTIASLSVCQESALCVFVVDAVTQAQCNDIHLFQRSQLFLSLW